MLALSATPIPRTLHMSLSGPPRHLDHRDTARGPAADPDDGRRVRRRVVRLALEREHAREGQSFYLHNRVETIEEAAEKLRSSARGCASSSRTAR